MHEQLAQSRVRPFSPRTTSRWDLVDEMAFLGWIPEPSAPRYFRLFWGLSSLSQPQLPHKIAVHTPNGHVKNLRTIINCASGRLNAEHFRILHLHLVLVGSDEVGRARKPRYDSSVSACDSRTPLDCKK
jgi:hypothetical protein